MNDEPPRPATYSTRLVISVLIFSLSWPTQLLFWACPVFDIPLQVTRPAARYALLSITILSSLLVRYVGRQEFGRILQVGGRFHVTGVQAIVIPLVVVTYSTFMIWALGLLD